MLNNSQNDSKGNSKINNSNLSEINKIISNDYNQIIENLTEFLIKLENFNINLNQKITQEFLLQIFNEIRDAIYYKLNSSQELSNYITIINKIVDSIITNLTNSLENNNTQITENLISFLERLFYLLIFHFNIEIINTSFKLLNTLISETDYEFHKSLLIFLIKILHILKVKKSVNAIVTNKIMSNISLSIIIILNKSNQETKKIFMDFVNENYKDYIFNYILCGVCNNEINFSKMFQIDVIIQFIEKNTKDLEKLNQGLESSISLMKSEQSLTTKTKVKQTIDFIGCICKVIDSFNIRENKTYNYDKVIKTNLIPQLKKFWNLVLFIQDNYFYEVDLTTESIHSIINLSDNLDILSFDLLLPLLNWIGIFLEKNMKYVTIVKIVVMLISRSELPKETSIEIANVVIEMLERILCNNLEKNDPIVVLVIDALEKFPQYPQLEFQEEIKLTKDIYLSIRNGILNDEIVNNLNDSTSNFEKFNKEYKDVLVEKINFEFTNLSLKNNPNELFKTSLLKYQEFKNSLKSIYGLNSYNLMIDNKINNFMDKNLEVNEVKNNFENFFLETSIEMFKEIFNHKNK